MANEKRLIDAFESICKKCDHYLVCKYVDDETAECSQYKAPTVDAVEVVHAEWVCVNESENVWMCTGDNGCGNEILLLEGTPSENGWHCCPNCGAKMDGGNEDGK